MESKPVVCESCPSGRHIHRIRMYVRPVKQKRSVSAEGRGGCVVTWNVQSFKVTAENNTVETGLLFFVNSVMKSAHKEHTVA